MIHRYTTFIKAVNLTIDYIILNLSMVIAYLIEDKSYISWISNKSYLPVVFVFNLIWLLSANVTGLYEHVLNKDSITCISRPYKNLSAICKLYMLYHNYTYRYKSIFYYPRIPVFFTGAIWLFAGFLEADIPEHTPQRQGFTH
jgi:hypothetical protein